MKAYYKNVGLSTLCDLFGYTRQAWYAHQNRQERRLFDESIIIQAVKRERSEARRIGTRTLFGILHEEFKAHGIKMGRDAFFEVLRQHDLLIRPQQKYTITTNSHHRFRKYPNLTLGLQVEQSERIWVSDITYIRVGQGFYYLILITDAYSRKIVGYNFANTMDAAFCVQTLQNALAQRDYPERELIHHSDRGIQYCSKKYTEVLLQNSVKISMTENGSPYENALAERMNRTLKDHFDLGRTFSSAFEAKRAVEISIKYYNGRRPHSSCDLMTPNEAHKKQGVLKKHWKTPAERKLNQSKHQELESTTAH